MNTAAIATAPTVTPFTQNLKQQQQKQQTAKEAIAANIQALIVAVGREALSENGEWLIAHRARPLEP